MPSLNQALLNQAIATHKVGSVVDDTPVGIRLKYIGTGTVTTVTVDTDEDVTLVTSDGGTDEYLLATYTTFGALVDAINKDGIFEARILDGLRADSTASSPFVNDLDVTISSAGYFDALIDTSVQQTMTFRCAVDRGVRTNRPAGGHRVHVQEIDYNVNVNAAQADGVQIHEWDVNLKTETQILRRASVDATATQVNWASGEGRVTGGWGNELIVRITDDTSITDADANYLNVSYIVE